MQISAGPEMQCTFVNVFQISRHFITNLIMTDCYSGKLLTFSYQKRSERRGASVIQIDLTNYNWEYLVCVRKEVAVYGMRKTNFKLFVELNNQTFRTHVSMYIPIYSDTLLEGALRIPDHSLQRVLHELLLGEPVYLTPLQGDDIARGVVVDLYVTSAPLIPVQPKS